MATETTKNQKIADLDIFRPGRSLGRPQEWTRIPPRGSLPPCLPQHLRPGRAGCTPGRGTRHAGAGVAFDAPRDRRARKDRATPLTTRILGAAGTPVRRPRRRDGTRLDPPSPAPAKNGTQVMGLHRRPRQREPP